MDIVSLLLTVFGLAIFEIVISIDNAIINAEVLSTMSKKGRKWFLLWGIIIAVFLVRGLLPWLIVFASNPSLGFLGSFTASFSNDPHIKEHNHDIDKVLKGAQVLILAMNHDEYKKLDAGFIMSHAAPECLVCDIWNILGENRVFKDFELHFEQG